LEPWKGILFYGPPGTGKTQLARAVATEIKSTFISISASDLYSKWQGQSEKVVKEVFRLAREKKPSIIFVDEIDAVLSQRNESNSESSVRVKTEFMQQMDGLKSNSSPSGDGDESGGGGVLVLGATNMPWSLDEAVLRRFQKRIYIPLPDREARAEIIKIHLRKTQHTLSDDQFLEIADKTEGFSGADISIMVNDAMFESIRKYKDATHFRLLETGKYIPISVGVDREKEVEGSVVMSWKDLKDDQVMSLPTTMDDFLAIIGKSKPSNGNINEKNYEDFTNNYGNK
jgi:vacuolar protein-sorting-associated protein 4